MGMPMCLSECSVYSNAPHLEYTSPFAYLIASMHKPGHASVLPGHIDPMLMPESAREAEMLLILLEMGLYPKIIPAEPEKICPDQG